VTTVSPKKLLNSLVENVEMQITKPNSNHQLLLENLNKNKIPKGQYILSIVIPMFNEEETIGNILERLPKHDKIEIIVVDDCSTDNSLKKIHACNHKEHIKVISHHKNRGYGGALLTGIKNSRGKIILTMDSDGQHRPEDIYSLIKPILNKEADYTIGSRYKGTYFYNLPVTTRIGEAMIEKLIRIFFGPIVSNNQNGFRAFDRKMMHIFNDIKYQGFAFATELILKAAIFKYRIKECPITLLDRAHGNSKIKLRALTMNLFSCLIRYFLKKLRMHLFGHQKPYQNVF